MKFNYLGVEMAWNIIQRIRRPIKARISASGMLYGETVYECAEQN